MFDENSGLAKVWVDLVRAGFYDITQVPAISNLKAVVTAVIEG